MKPGNRLSTSSNLLRIERLNPYDIASAAGLRAGDIVKQINGHQIHDVIDLQFYISDPDLDIIIDRQGRELQFHIKNPEMISLGIEPESMDFGCCGNQCVFCFIDQNPKGMRSSLYLKDEDYRLSFMHGNYVTLTRVSQTELNRIAEQRLSPLYLSVHAVDPVIRKRMLGIKKDDNVIEKLKFLADHDIEIHGQIVLCPGLNDGRSLEDTIKILSSFHPHFHTLAVVPVGLTKHRLELPQISPVTSEIAVNVIQQVQNHQEIFREKLGHAFVYLADEFYLSANEALPPDEHYGDYWQIENGVGMTRSFLNEFDHQVQRFPAKIKKQDRVVVVTGTLAAPVLQQFVFPVLNKIKGLDLNIHPVENEFYGSTVTVSGLLTGQDIQKSLSSLSGDYRVVLPENCINHDRVFLDDMTPDELAESIRHPVSVISDFGELWN